MTDHNPFVFSFGEFELREREFLLISAGEPVAVEPRAFKVLQFLLHNPGRAIPKDELLDAVWNDCEVSQNSLTRSVAILRRLLGDDIREPRYIATVPTVGYRFVCPVKASEDPTDRHVAQDPLRAMATVRADLGRLTVTSTTAQKTAFHDRMPLIGREQEFAELMRLLGEALAGRGSLVIIGGEPGIGKTHLTGAILEEGRRRGAFGVIGHCYEMEGSPPYVPFIEILEYFAQMASREGLRTSLGDDAPEVAKLMPELRNMYPDIPAPIQLPPEQQRRFLFNAYRSFVERSSRVTPIVAVLEDLHWADEATLLLLQHIAQTLPTMGMLIICTYRDVELDVTRPFARTLETLLRQKRATRMALRRLPVSGVEAMLAAMSGQKPPPSLARFVFAQTEGNPYFVEEVFRHLAEEGKLFNETGKWLPALRVNRLQVPEGVRLVLGRRLDRLGVDARRVLTTAAVIGRSFSLLLLEDLENKQPDAALDAVEEAEKAHLVVAEPAGRDTRYRFVHELVRHTAAESLSLPRRQRLHARVAEAIERVYSANLEAHASALAHHLYEAGTAADPEKTTTYLMQAARQAMEAAGHEEALAHLDNALSLWEGAASLRVAELMFQRAGALRSMGRADEAVASYQQASNLFEAQGELARVVETYADLFTVRAWYTDVDAAKSILERVQKYLDGADLRSKITLLTMALLHQVWSGSVAAAAITLAQVKDLHQAAGIPFAGLPARAELLFLWSSGQFARILELGPRAAAEFRRSGDRWREAEIRYLCLAAEIFCGRLSHAAAALPDAILPAERMGHFGALWALKSQAASLTAARGDLAAAERDMREAWEFGQAHGVAWSFTYRVSLADYAFYRGDLAEAERTCSDPSGMEPKTYWAGIFDSAGFSLFALCGSKRAAETWARRSWKLPVAGQLNSLGSWCALIASTIGLASMGRKAEAALLRPLTEQLLLTGAWQIRTGALCQTVAGVAAACAGDFDAAEEHHLTAIRQADTAPYKHLQPMAREWYASMLVDRGSAHNSAGDAVKGRAQLQEAVNMYEAMGMTYPAMLASKKILAI